MSKMKDFANEMRMTSNFRKMLELAMEDTGMELDTDQLDTLAEMMVSHFDEFTEKFLMGLHQKDEEKAWIIADEIAGDKDTPITLLYECSMELVVLILANQAMLFASLGGLDENK